MDDKQTTYSKQVIEIAGFLLKNTDKKMSDVLSYFVVKYNKNRRTIERYCKQAKEYNKKRIQPEKEKGICKGRQTTYNNDYNERVFKLCLLGATDKDIADFFNIAESTLNKWKHDYPEFSESIKKGKKDADANIGASLYSRAKGFVKKDCEKVFNYQGNIVRAKVAEYFPPDTTAAIFWLKNRQPDLWRDKQIQGWDGTQKIESTITIKNPLEEIRKIYGIDNKTDSGNEATD